MLKMVKFIILCLSLIGMKSLPSTCHPDPLSNFDQKAYNKFQSVLKNSTWIVPPSTLQAIQYIDGVSVPVTDQTVWVIDSFNNGYFLGDAYVAISGNATSHLKLVGSVTPFGDVYITFYPTTGNLLPTDVVNGIGKLTRINHQYIFVMQMNSAQNNLEGLSHWSYMISVVPKDYFYHHLPSLNISVPQFINQFM